MHPVRSTMGALFALLCVFSGTGHAQSVRISVAEFSENPQQVDTLKQAIDAMRKASDADRMSAEFRTSLAYWANTHGYIGTGTHATNREAYITNFRMPQCLRAYPKATCDLYYAHVADTSPPPDGFTDAIWGTCQHGNLFFLPWHRFYLHFFERTVRKHAGDPNFALPYWNYFDNYSPTRRGIALPPLVLGDGNSLYDTWRTPGLNEARVVMDPKSADATQAFAFTDFTNFSNTLQGQPHGAMHCAVGSQCVMPDIGLVPIAGADPVFYMHHANIDRLWQCWMVREADGQPIDLAWAKANLGMPDAWYEQTYTFIDENGDPVTVKVADVFSPEYTPRYDAVEDCADNPAAKRSLLLATAEKGLSPLKTHRLQVVDTPVILGNEAVTVDLKAQATTPPAALEKSEKAAAPEGHTYLVLEDVTLVGLPTLTYQVSITHKRKPGKSSYIATFSFFGAGPAHEGHGEANSLGTLVYQVSGNLAELGIRSADDIGIRFEPTNLLVGEALGEQEAGNGVTVGRIRLQTSAEAPQE